MAICRRFVVEFFLFFGDSSQTTGRTERSANHFSRKSNWPVKSHKL